MAQQTMDAPAEPARGLPPRNIEVLMQMSGWPFEHVEATLESGRGKEKLVQAIKSRNPDREVQDILVQIEKAEGEFRQTGEAKREFFKDTWVGRRMVDTKNLLWNNKWKLLGLGATLLGINYASNNWGKIKDWGGNQADKGVTWLSDKLGLGKMKDALAASKAKYDALHQKYDDLTKPKVDKFAPSLTGEGKKAIDPDAAVDALKGKSPAVVPDHAKVPGAEPLPPSVEVKPSLVPSAEPKIPGASPKAIPKELPKDRTKQPE